jgi:hypothetical protein
MKVSGEVRPILLKNSIFFEVAGIRLEWPAGISQTSDALWAGRLRESLSLLAGIGKIGC